MSERVLDDEVQQINQRKFDEMLRLQGRASAGGQEASGRPIELTDANFEQQVKSHPVMVVDFWAPWCGPCRLVGPVLEEIASEMAGKVTVGKLNVDDNQRTAMAFGVQSIPTILVFRDGEAVDGMVGAAPKSMIEAKIKSHLRGN